MSDFYFLIQCGCYECGFRLLNVYLLRVWLRKTSEEGEGGRGVTNIIAIISVHITIVLSKLNCIKWPKPTAYDDRCVLSCRFGSRRSDSTMASDFTDLGTVSNLYLLI